MSVWAISRVKDEEDIIARTVGQMASQVDHVLIQDNASSDGTREILEGLGVEIEDDPEIAYYQARYMTQLAQRAAEGGADWVIPFDADEFWYSPHGRIADLLEQHPNHAIAPAQMIDHRATAADPEEADPILRMGWRRREDLPLPKVACRTNIRVEIAEGNHDAFYAAERVSDLLVVRHYPYRSAEQMIRKVKNGRAGRAATDLPKSVGSHWHEYGAILDNEGEEGLSEVFRRWFWSADPERDKKLMWDPCPLS